MALKKLIDGAVDASANRLTKDDKIIRKTSESGRLKDAVAPQYFMSRSTFNKTFEASV